MFSEKIEGFSRKLKSEFLAGNDRPGGIQNLMQGIEIFKIKNFPKSEISRQTYSPKTFHEKIEQFLRKLNFHFRAGK
jgi:hypothetical protein